MSWVMTLVTALQVIAALIMIGLILMQHGKGADMGASFGGGAAGSLFGAAGSANAMSRATAICATVFFACTLALAYMANKQAAAPVGSVLDQPSASASAASAPAARGAALIPSAPAPAPAPAASTVAPAVAASGMAAVPATK
jgi:preprotein translocase subunit SecG